MPSPHPVPGACPASPRPHSMPVPGVELSVWATAQQDARTQRRGRYLPASTAHPAKMLPAIAITPYTRPGDLVADPMCGIGTTLVEAIHLVAAGDGQGGVPGVGSPGASTRSGPPGRSRASSPGRRVQAGGQPGKRVLAAAGDEGQNAPARGCGGLDHRGRAVGHGDQVAGPRRPWPYMTRSRPS